MVATDGYQFPSYNVMFSSREAFQRFADIVSCPEETIPVAEAALVASTDCNAQLEVSQYLDWVSDAAEKAPAPGPPEAFADYFTKSLGFRGDTQNYHDPENSLLDRVIERRRGMPITLCVLFIEISARRGWEFEGVGFPGHFLVRHASTRSFLDPFHGSDVLSPTRAKQRIQSLHGENAWAEGQRAATPREILFRLLTNLKLSLLEQQDYDDAATVQEKLLVLAPNRPQEYRDLGVVSASAGDWAMARKFLGEYLELKPDADDAELVRAQLQFLNDEAARRN